MILALDTSSASGSAAVLRDGVIIAERRGDPTRTHGERLPRELMAVLEEARADLDDVTAFAVCTGPGSFTGLRVGIATIQGLAFAQRKLVVPISAFEALARTSNLNENPNPNANPGTSELQNSRTSQPFLVATWIDAHRGEVFACLYGPDRRVVRDATSLPPAATLDDWVNSGLSADAAIRFEGDGAIKYAGVIRERLPHATVAAAVPLLAGTIARLADAELDRAVTPHAVVPLYVRRPDAELARARRASTTTPGKR
jgi:tRNA threonylcarbamoyladenosine biosynthesis protein TsaB